MNTPSRAYAEINLDAILHNMSQMQRILQPGTKIMPVIKADAYGHGAIPIGKELEPLSITWGYATATVEEAQALRSSGLEKPILVLGATFPDQYRLLPDLGIRPAVFSLRQALALEESAAWVPAEHRIHFLEFCQLLLCHRLIPVVRFGKMRKNPFYYNMGHCRNLCNLFCGFLGNLEAKAA